MTDLSEEMQEAIRILRSDERAVAFRNMTESNQALVARLDKKDADDATWRKEWEERYAQTAGSPPNNGDPGVGDPGTGQKGPGSDEGEGGAPPPPAIEPPKTDEKPKKKSRWWGELEDD